MTDAGDGPVDASTDGMAAFEARIELTVFPGHVSDVLVERTVFGVLPEDGPFQVSIDDTSNMVLEAVVSFGERVADGTGMKYSSSMPGYLEQFAAAVLEVAESYDADDDERQNGNRSQIGLEPLE